MVGEVAPVNPIDGTQPVKLDQYNQPIVPGSTAASTPTPQYDTGPYGIKDTVPIRGVGTLQQQTNAALQATPEVNRNPTFVTEPIGTSLPDVGTADYIDKYGRIATGRIDAQGRFIIKPDNPPPAPTPTTPNPTPTLPTTPGVDPTKIDGDPKVDNTANPTSALNLSSVAGLIGVARLANGAWGLINSGNPDSLLNTGLFSGIENQVDEFGNSIAPSAFSPAPNSINGSAGWTWNSDSGYYELTNPDALGSNVGDTTLTNAIGYGNFGSFVANLLGFSTGSFFGDLATGTIGGIAGGYIGGEIGGTLLGIGAGALGGFIGGFALTAIISAFGPRPSDMLAGGMWDSGTQSMDKTWTYQGQKYSATNNQNRDDFFGYVGTLQNNIASTFGVKAADLNVGKIRLDLGRYTGVAVNIGDVGYGDQDTGKDFGNGQAALDYVGKTMLQKMQNTNDDVKYVQSNIDWDSTNFDQATGKMTFAQDFSKTSQAFINGSFTIDQNRNDSLATIDSWAAQAHALLGNDPDGKYQPIIDRAVTVAKSKIFDNFANVA